MMGHDETHHLKLATNAANKTKKQKQQNIKTQNKHQTYKCLYVGHRNRKKLQPKHA